MSKADKQLYLLSLPAYNFFWSKMFFFEHNAATAIIVFIQVVLVFASLWILEYFLSKSETKQKESELKLKAVFDNTVTGYILLDSDFNIISFNNKGSELVKLSTGNSLQINTGMASLFPPDTYLNYSDEFNKVMNGESIYMELNCSTTEKGVLWISISGKPVMDDQNSVIGISIGLNDITESKQLLFKLTASENNLKSMLQHANESIILTDDNGNIIFWNIISEKIFGYREDEILGKPLSLILPKHSKTDRQRIIQHISKWQSITNDKSIELTGIRKDDTELPLEISPSFWINDNVTYYSVAIRDISDRKKSEKEILLMNKQLQEHASHMQTVREEERTMIAREIHDELGQQLAYIKMEAERINKKAANDEMLKEMTTEMVDQIGITINAVRKLHSELRPPTLDNLGLFDTIEWKAKDFSFKTGLKCTLHFDNAEPILKQGFAIHVFRIFQESINNCYKYAEASEINIGLKQADGNLIMIIKDNGKGFDLEKVKQNKSFGLQGMKERTKIIDGTIEIISEEEKGTTIVLTVPIN